MLSVKMWGHDLLSLRVFAVLLLSLGVSPSGRDFAAVAIRLQCVTKEASDLEAAGNIIIDGSDDPEDDGDSLLPGTPTSANVTGSSSRRSLRAARSQWTSAKSSSDVVDPGGALAPRDLSLQDKCDGLLDGADGWKEVFTGTLFANPSAKSTVRRKHETAIRRFLPVNKWHSVEQAQMNRWRKHRILEFSMFRRVAKFASHLQVAARSRRCSSSTLGKRT